MLSAQLAAMQDLQAENQKQASENDQLRNQLLEKQGEIEALRVRYLGCAHRPVAQQQCHCAVEMRTARVLPPHSKEDRCQTSLLYNSPTLFAVFVTR